MLGKEYFQGGDAVFTIEPGLELSAKFNVENRHYTYWITFVEGDKSKGQRDTFFIKLFVGTENTNPKHYRYLGILNVKQGDVICTAGSKIDPADFAVRILRMTICRIWDGKGAELAAMGVSVRHNDHCSRCGKRLTTPTSLDIGVGPECLKMMCAAVKMPADLFTMQPA